MRGLVRAILVIAVGAAMVVVAIRFPVRGWDIAAPTAADAATLGTGATGTTAVSRSALVCPGPETVGVKKVDTTTAAAPTIVRAAAPPADLISPAGSATTGTVTGKALGGSGKASFRTLSAAGAGATSVQTARSILFSGSGSLAPGLVASQVTAMTTGDARGLSSSACTAPTADTWLVGSGADTGRRGRIVLTNPAPNAVTVVLQAFGAHGQLPAAAGRGIVVGAHKRVVVLLDALAPGESTPVVHVVTHGGLIGVAMSDAWLDGTTPAGADDIVGTQPGTSLVVPGVIAGGLPGSTLLRVAATSGAATVHVRLLSVSGPLAAPGEAAVLKVAGGSVVTADLSAVTQGLYAVQLSSDAPIVAGVQMHPAAATAGGSQDLAWSSAEPALDGLTGVPLGPVVAPWSEVLGLTAADADSTVDVVTVAADGAESSEPVSVPGGTAVLVHLTSPASSVWIKPDTGAVQAALVTTYADPAGQLLSVLPLPSAPDRVARAAVHPQAG